ncbi:MAG: hypothetical protein R3F65_21530 [bacterium]
MLVALGPVPAAVLFAAFGYNMRYAGPIAVLTCLERTSREGILVKDGRALELLATVDVVVFDKTGTLTADVLWWRCMWWGRGTRGVAGGGGGVRGYQRHPIALAVVAEAEGRGVVVPEAVDVAQEVGVGGAGAGGRRRRW